MAFDYNLILENVRKIMIAIYGEEVRESIAGSIRSMADGVLDMESNTTAIEKIIGKNKINPEQISKDLYYSLGSTMLASRTPDTIFCVSNLIEVIEGTTYVVSGTAATDTGGYFDQSAILTPNQKAKASIIFATVPGGAKFTVPTGEGIKYIAVNLKFNTNTQSINGTYQIEVGDAPTTIEPYQQWNKLKDPYFDDATILQLLKDDIITTSMVKDKAITPVKTSFIDTFPKKNLINLNKIDMTLYYSPGSTMIKSRTSDTISCSTELIPVVEGEWYTVSGTAMGYSGGYFKSDDTLEDGQQAISSIEFATPVDDRGKCFQVPLGKGIKYIAINLVVNISNQIISGDYQLELGEQATTIEPYQLVSQMNPNYLPKQEVKVPNFNDWFSYLEGISYGNIDNIISNFRKHWIAKDKDLVVVGTGTSLTARSSEHCSIKADGTKRPPLLHSNNFASYLWDKIKWEGQQYRRFDDGFFSEVGTFQTQSNIADWDDGPYRYGLTRYSEGNSSIAFTIPINAWQFNFIYRSDILGSEACTLKIAEGVGNVEVWNGFSWVEANGYTFSMKETEKYLKDIIVPDPLTIGNPKNITIPSYKIGGNTTYQKRLKMRCKSKLIDSRNITKDVTISSNAGRLLYWGVEWSPREFMITYINSARGSHNMTANSSNGLQHYQDNELWSFNPDIIVTENPIHNSGGAGSTDGFSAYPSGYWGDITNNFFFNVDSPISLQSRAKEHNINNLEWVIFNSSITWNFGGIDDNGELKLSADKEGLIITALDAQMKTYEWLKENKPDVIAINATRYWVYAGTRLFGNLKLATLGSGKTGKTFTNEGSHWNDTGSRVMAKCILPVFDFLV